MKRIISLVLVLTLIAGTSVANPVNPNAARKAAAAFLSASGPKYSTSQLTDISSATPFNNMYIFSINDGKGFIVMSADDNTTPVLAYSPNNAFPTDNMPDHVRSWFYNYERSIDINRICAPSDNVRREWAELYDGKDSKDVEYVGPFLTTQWNQSPLYNLYCPYDSAHHGRAVAGCTAIATAQIMKYFNHPAHGYGNETYTHKRLGQLSANYDVDYLWDSMPDIINNTSSEAQIDAVATIVYHVGVAVNMDYDANGSAGKTASYGYGGDASSENAFKYNFKYSPYVWTAFRIDYSINDWKQLLVNELDNGRPILYAGYDEVQSGHAFVCDGYKRSGALISFHFNWGWGGAYDGYYKIDNLNPSSFALGNSGYHFDLFATATIGIEPYSGWDTEGTTTVSTSTEGIGGAVATDGTVSGAGTYNFGDTITLEANATNEHSRFVAWSDGCRYNPRSTVATGGQIAFTAIFAPLMGDIVRYHTCDNSMNRAANIPEGLGTDTVWGIKIPASAIKSGATLNAVRFMGRKQATHTLTILAGNDTPDETLYNATFVDSLDYDYTFHTHTLPSPINLDGSKSLWIKLKCTEVDSNAVFSIYGGNTNSLLCGENLTPMGDSKKFSWMIEGLFSNNVGINTTSLLTSKAFVYPNPTTGSFSIDGIHRGDKVYILDANGRTVYTAACNGNSITISNANLLPGIYIIRISSDKYTSTHKLVVK